MSNANRKSTTAGGTYIFTKSQFRIGLSNDLVKSVNKNSTGDYKSWFIQLIND